MALVSGELCVIHFTISHMNVTLLEVTPVCILITPSGMIPHIFLICLQVILTG